MGISAKMPGVDVEGDAVMKINRKVIPERRFCRKLRVALQQQKRAKEFLKKHGYPKPGTGALDIR